MKYKKYFSDLDQCLSTAGTRPGTGTWRPSYWDLKYFSNFDFYQFYPIFDINFIFIPCFLTKINITLVFWRGTQHTWKYYRNKKLTNFFDRDLSFKTWLQPGLGALKVENHWDNSKFWLWIIHWKWFYLSCINL